MTLHNAMMTNPVIMNMYSKFSEIFTNSSPARLDINIIPLTKIKHSIIQYFKSCCECIAYFRIVKKSVIGSTATKSLSFIRIELMMCL